MRPLGVEIELNLIKENLKETIDYACCLVENLGLNCLSQGWSYNHNNTVWICKPDSSCGIEVCSPVLEDLFDLKKVLDVFKSDSKIKVDACYASADTLRHLGDFKKSADIYQSFVTAWPQDHRSADAQLLVGRCYEDLLKAGLITAKDANVKIKAAYENVLANYPDSNGAKIAKRWLDNQQH